MQNVKVKKAIWHLPLATGSICARPKGM